MSINPLNDITRVYLEQVIESAVPGKPAEKLGAVTLIPKSEQEAARERALAKAKAMREKKGITKEALDPVGQEDADIDNDGDTDKSDKYLHKRRKVIGKAIAKKKGMKEGFSNWREELELFEIVNKKEDKRITEKKVNNSSLIKINPKLGEAVEDLGGTLIEMLEVDEFDFIVESAYIELLDDGFDEEEIEEALEYALTEAKVTFGHDTPGASTEKKKEGLLSAARKKLSGAKAAAKKSIASGARKVARGAVAVARKMEGDKKPHTAERKPSTYRGAGAGQKEKVSSGSYKAPEKKKAKPVSDPWEGSYKKSSEIKTTKAKKAKPVSDPWEGSATTPPKPKAKKAVAKPKASVAKPEASAAKPKAATTKKKKSSKLDNLLSSIRNEQAQLQEKSLSKAQQRFMGMVYATKKGEMEAPSPEVAKAAAGMTKGEAKKFAKTKHKDLPEKKVQEQQQVPLSSQELQVQRQRAQLDTRLAMLRKQALSKMKKPETQDTADKKSVNETP